MAIVLFQQVHHRNENNNAGSQPAKEQVNRDFPGPDAQHWINLGVMSSSNEDFFKPLDITGKDGYIQLFKAISYAKDFLEGRLPEDEMERWNEAPLTFGDIIDYSKFEEQGAYEPYHTDIRKIDGQIVKIFVLAAENNTIYDIRPTLGNKIQVDYPFFYNPEKIGQKQGISIQFRYNNSEPFINSLNAIYKSVWKIW